MTPQRATTTRQIYVVEHYRSGFNADELRQQAERVRDAVDDMRRAGKAIGHVSSTVVPEDDYFQSMLEATSEHLVRAAHARAGISFERISVAFTIDGIARA